jgi:uncharacterized protein YecT (DUF1311 family)
MREMMQQLSLALALAVFAMIDPLIAQGQEIDGSVNVDMSDMDASLRRCSGPQQAMNGCARAHAQVAASQLQVASDHVRSTIEPQSQSSFDRAQAAYLAFVEASCEFEAGRYAGGSIVGWIHESCMARRLAARVRSLTAYAKYPDRDAAGLSLTDFDLGEPK